MSTPESRASLHATYALLFRYAQGEVPLADAVDVARALLHDPSGPHGLGIYSPDFTPEMEARLETLWRALIASDRAG